MKPYTQLEIINILISCNSATELLEVRCLLEDTGHTLQCVAMEVYNNFMNHFLVLDKVL